MSDELVDIGLLLLLLLMNGFFSLSEMAVVSSRKTRLDVLARTSRRAAMARDLAENPGRFLSAVQVGVTLAGIASGALGAATLVEGLSAWLASFPVLASWAQAIAYVAIIGTLAFLTLVLGELVPKRLALQAPEAIASAVAGPMRLVSLLTAPAIFVLDKSTGLVLRLMGRHHDPEPDVTEEEVREIVVEATRSGALEEAEQEIIGRVLRFTDRAVGAFMTQRSDVNWLDLDDPPAENLRRMLEDPHGYYPVAHGGLERVAGVVEMKDVAAQALRGESFDPKALVRDALYVPETARGPEVLGALREAGRPFAVVIDEHGDAIGVVTTADILSFVVGDLPEGGEEPPQAVQREDGSWLVDGLMPVDEVFAMLGLDPVPEAEAGAYHTLGGFVMAHLGRIPQAADRFEAYGRRWEVMDMDARRVDKVLVSEP